ncbi:MAG: class I SAM-dependent methyltransferase [Lachnospiraceae bacterium]|uniref:SAM-dependent methyltransferase n=1 Tax=Roseburia sp. 1XD42-69 TaxID=2320088 RepID=UPI000EA1E1E4|nr:cyclopropane-fatty-acyl-phospholipid synthase family protein [Roseburia sp. 1XD42-69]MCI8874841.1 class I SAM-dependent methyltransferase [Lachnospiraceae bacterium]RKJ67973.1 class I SAM-dependent methyltransferase [Roseburia sp. 1XD42-69]
MAVLEKEFVKFMGQFDACPFEIITGEKSHFIGKGEPKFSVTVHKLPGMKSLLKSTSIALGEAYMDGDIEIHGDLYETLNLFLGQIDKFYTDRWKLRKLMFTSGDKNNQKREVSSHYDIGNDFYRLWLDETLSYSCGYFKENDTTLYEAQCCKVERILEKLNLKEGMTLCDIGCGWGFLLMEAAKKYKVYGMGITLSQEQQKKCKERIKEEGLEEYVHVKLLDYRDLPELHIKFDRVVSVGMLEHVGRNNYLEFMSCVKRMLKPGGLFLLHYISALKEYPGDAWVKKYIFPGGVVPSLREIINIAGDLRFYTLDVEDLRRHYNKTLLCWNENFQRHRSEVAEMFDERFTRMWEMYLCACAAAFMNGVVDLHQILFSNDVNNEIPMTRWY